MKVFHARTSSFRIPRQCRKTLRAVVATALCIVFSGCAALTNPVADGVPVRYVGPELLAKPKDDAQTIPLDLLGQPPADVYRLAPDDVLGVWIEGVMGDSSKGVSVISALPVLNREQRRLAPSLGSPVPVREDGTVRLPMIDPIKVEGLTLAEAEDAIKSVYAKKQIIPVGRERVLVSLMFQRQTHVVVLRQESGNITLGPSGGLAGGKRSTGHQVDLQPGENDVLHALSATGGLPGLDAYNEVIIFRNCWRTERDHTVLLEKVRNLPPGADPAKAVTAGGRTIRIPLRRRPGEDLPFGPEDVILHTGDVVFIEARDQDLFYTAGLLPAGEQVLPRDYDLDVVKAVARVQGPMVNGAFNTNNLAGNLITPGLGSPSPRLLTVLRRTPDGGQVPIRVDLHRALRDPRERIIVRAGDVLILQEQPADALTRYFSQSLFNFEFVWHAIRGTNVSGVVNLAAPDRLSTVSSPTVP